MRKVRDGDVLRDPCRYCKESHGENYALCLNKIFDYEIIVLVNVIM
jgi:hypothetical protein